ncbi:MAG TPA: hypothetical protein VF532_04730 [Candidatus Angelobacter sp.]
MTDKRRFAISVIAVFCVFCSMNLLLLAHAYSIHDYPRTYGFPVPVYTDSTWGGSHLAFLAIPIDVLALLGLAAVVFLVWKKSNARRPI